MAAVLSPQSPVIGPTPGEFEDYALLLPPSTTATTNCEEEEQEESSSLTTTPSTETIEEEEDEEAMEVDDDDDGKNDESNEEESLEDVYNPKDVATTKADVNANKDDQKDSSMTNSSNKDSSKTLSKDKDSLHPTDQTDTSSTPTLKSVSSKESPQKTFNIKQKRTQYGGLRNLGNTCYLNSALQMIFSLDHFIADLERLKLQLDHALAVSQPEQHVESNDDDDDDDEKEEEETTEEEPMMVDEEGNGYNLLFGFANDDNDQENTKESNTTKPKETKANNKKETSSPYPLLNALLETSHALTQASSSSSSSSNSDSPSSFYTSATSPQKLKQILDEKTPLFLGYFQQDSHEFLSTLIDLLEEEVKKVMLEYHIGVEEITEESKEENTMEEDEDESEEDQENTQGKNETKENEDENDENDEDESLRKRAKHDDSQQQQSSSSSSSSSFSERTVMKRASSLAELNLEAISDLLHGPTSTTTPSTSSSSSSSSSSPKTSSMTKKSHSSPSLCKLAGGRMVNPPSMLPTVIDSEAMASSTANTTTTTITTATTLPDVEEKEAVVQHEEQEIEEEHTMSMDDKDDDAEKEEQSKPKLHVPSTPFSETFTTQIRNTLTCDSCCYSRSHIESYNHLSLEVEEGDDCSSIEEGLRKFLAEEKRELKCEKCFCESATQKMEIVKLPKALLLHLKRFIVDFSPCYTNVSYRKNRSAVEFPQVLSLLPPPSLSSSAAAVDASSVLLEGDANGVLGEFLAKDVVIPLESSSLLSLTTEDETCAMKEESEESVEEEEDNEEEEEDQIESFQKYKLRSVVHHIGTSASCGHYTADAIRPYDQSSSEEDEEEEEEGACKKQKLDWTRFNDSNVSIISEKEATGPSAQRTAYMVVYSLE